jgi:hypothetical protein
MFFGMKKTPQLRERCPEFIEYLMGDIDTHIGFLLACGISLSIARFKPLAVRLIGRLALNLLKKERYLLLWKKKIIKLL